MIGLKSENEAAAAQQSKYYTINKHLFHYFIALYGGGPALVQNQIYKQVECAIMPMRAENEAYDGEESKSSARYRRTVYNLQ